MPFFDETDLLPDDPILGLPVIFAADPRPFKINLGIGVYRTAEGQAFVLESVKKAESLILQKNLSKDYLPIEGSHELIQLTLPLLFGHDHPVLQAGPLFAAQTVGGSGALRLAGELLAKLVTKTLFLSQPSWSNHKQIFEKAGLSIGYYPYCQAQSASLDFPAMLNAIRHMPPSSAIVLHACCHNPTGLDPSFEQWKELSAVIKQQQIIPIFDLAYQGFGQGLDRDAEAVRYFASEGHEMLVTYSFSKNLGLYGERLGLLVVLMDKPELVPKIASQVKFLIRCNYSNPPLQGARIASTILKSPELLIDWKRELNQMRERVTTMREALIAALSAKGRDFSYMHQQKGLFSMCGLQPDQVHYLRQEKGIYMPENGRINVAGLNSQNIDYVADALISVL